MADDNPIKAMLSWELNGPQALHLREGDTAEIGRDKSNTVTLPLGQVSRRHAVIAWREKQFEVQDLGSMNGTMVNSVRLEGPHILADGDQIGVSNVTMNFRLVNETPRPQKEANLTLIVSSDAPRPRLIISAGLQEGREIRLTPGIMRIGRATSRTDDWEIALQDRTVSRPHAEITGADDGFTITDAGSANGTIINGATIGEQVRLHDGDVIVVGETTLIFRSK